MLLGVIWTVVGTLPGILFEVGVFVFLEDVAEVLGVEVLVGGGFAVVVVIVVVSLVDVVAVGNIAPDCVTGSVLGGFGKKSVSVS